MSTTVTPFTTAQQAQISRINGGMQALDLGGAIGAVQTAVTELQSNAVDVHASVVCATTSALAASTYANGTAGVGATLTADANGALGAIDGVTPTAGQRILIKDQASGLQNGVYTLTQAGSGSTPFILTRATDFDQAAEITDGSYFFVEQGTTNGDSAWVMTTNGTITVGTTALVFTQFSGLGQITAGAGLTKTGNTLAVGAGNGITVNADDVALASSAAGAGLTYTTGVLAVGAGDGITVAADSVALASTAAGDGLTYTTGVLAVGAGDGITVAADSVSLASSTAGGGLTYTTGVLAVGAGTGVTVNADDVALAYDATVPEPLGTAAAGSSAAPAHRDHVHAHGDLSGTATTMHTGASVAYPTADASKNKIPDAADQVTAALDGLDVAMPYDSAAYAAAAADRVTNTASETAFATTYTLPANALAAGSEWEVITAIKVAGITGTPDLTVRLKLDGNTAISAILNNMAGAGYMFVLRWKVSVGLAGASGVALVETSAMASTSASTPTGVAETAVTGAGVFTNNTSLNDGSFDTTATHAVTVTAQWDAADAGNQADLRFLKSSYRLAAAVT